MSLQTKRRLWFFFAFCVVFLIFLFSSQNGEQSKETSGFFVALFPFIEDQEQLTFVIRKLAHFSIFACLAFCLFQAVDTYDISLPKKIIYTLLFCILYAIFDEWHQSFTPERSPQILDIGIDSLGSFTSIALTNLYHKLRR